MRLHLPKTLLAAVLAACASLDAYAGVSGSAFEINSTEINESESMSGYATFSDGTYTSINTDPAGKTAVTTIRPGDSTTGTIAQLNVASDKALSISANRTSNFTDLTISQINVAETGSATLNIAGAQVVKIGRASGIVNFAVSGAGAGELIFNGRGTYGNYTTTSDGNYTRKIQVTDSSTVTFDTITNSWGMGAIDVAAGSELNATSIILKSGDNSGGDLQGGKITGAGRVSATTLDAGNVGNYTVSVADFEAGTLNASWRAEGKMLTLSSSTLTIETLNQTNGIVKITSATSAEITSLNISGGIIDASGMAGTLTISGATWTGDLTTASVEVVRAKDASTARDLAVSMNTTHGLNYSFSASENSVCREVRTTSEFTATTDGADKPRIVIGNINYADKNFNNVGMSDLLAGDKVSINGLTGWIGQNGSNTILADLKFTGENHINDGSSTNNWITYSGAITGDGTLSYEWGTKAYTYNFNGDLSGFTGTISDTTTLNVTIGGTLADGVSNAVRATIDIAGNLTVNRETTFTEGFTANQLKGSQKIVFDGAQTINCTQDGDFSGNIDVKSGKLTVKGLVKTTGDFDLCGPSATNRYRGTVEVASQGRLTLAGNNIWGLANSAKILLQENGSLKWSDLLITGKAAIADVETGLTIGATEALSTTQSLNTLRNSTVTYTGTGSKTLRWILDGCGVSVSTGTLTVNGTNTDTALNVSGGSALFDNSTSTSLADSTVSGGTVKLSGYYTTLNGTLNISGGTVINTAVGTKDPDTVNEIEAPLKLGQGGKVVISVGSLENDGFTYTKTDTASTAGTNDASLALTNNATSGSLKVFGGDLKITKATMTKTEKADKGIGIALDNVTLVLGEDTKTTTLRKDGETGKTQNLSGVSVASGAALKVENTNATLGDVSGAGTVSTSVDNAFSLARDAGGTGSSFSGTLETTKGTLTVTGVGTLEDGVYLPHAMTALKASGGGELNVMETPLVSITEMVIGAGSTVGVYTGSTTGEAQEGDVYMHGTFGDNAKKGSLTIESGAKLNADLQLINTTLTFNGTLTMGSDLTLYSGNELAGSLYDSWDKKSDLTLFTGVDNLYIGSDEAVADKEYEASSVFSNIGDGYSLKMLSGTAGNYSVMLVQSSNPTPEPTTATLSLLALMGLAARRRRKA